MNRRWQSKLRSLLTMLLVLLLALPGASGCLAPEPTPTPTPTPTATPTATPTPPPPTPVPTPTNTPPATEGLEPPEPAPPGFQKGMSYATWWQGNYSSAASDQALAELVETGTQWLSLIVTCYQEAVPSTEITCDLPRTPTDDDLLHALETARELGFKVMLKPHLDLNSDDAHWRGDIGSAFTTEDEWTAWFEAYQAMIVHYATLAEDQRLEQFCVGTELLGTSRREDQWRAIVEAVREVYSGNLVYASNHGEERSITWWDALDYIGVDAYYALTSSNHPSLDDLKAAWRMRVVALGRISQSFDRPVVITEIGYRSMDGANSAPWAWSNAGEVDLHEQALCYRAALESFWSQPWLAGLYWWNWDTDPGQGGEQDIGFTPHGKPAEEILKTYYRASAR